jgi:5-formyltetrahydrofolate cyclo-ligase
VTAIGLEDQKASLRLTALARRGAMQAGDRADAAQAAAAHFFAGLALDRDQIVAAYWPIRDEIDCRPVLTQLVDTGQPVCLPAVGEAGDDALIFRMWEEGAALYPSGFGTLAPVETALAVEPDVIIIPLLGFDVHGTRLGYGKGHYDRTLAAMQKRPMLIGYAFSSQELDYIPREAHDVPLDVMVTDAGVRHFGAAGPR